MNALDLLALTTTTDRRIFKAAIEICEERYFLALVYGLQTVDNYEFRKKENV